MKKIEGKKLALRGLAGTIDFAAELYDLFRVPKLEKQEIAMQKRMFHFGNKIRQHGGDQPKSHLILRKKGLWEIIE